MKITEFFKTYKRYHRQKKSGVSFPVRAKIHGVKNCVHQGALAQSENGDRLQLVQVPLEEYPYNVYVYSITLNRILGYLDKPLAEKLIYIFGKGFCLDGTINEIIGGPPLKYRGAIIDIFDDNVFMNDADVSALYEP